MHLEKHKDLKIENKVIIEKNVVYKQTGSTAPKRGQFMFAWDTDKNEAYKVVLEEKTAYNVSEEKGVGKYNAKINAKHPMLWAINLKNATRKFKKKLNL